MNAFSQAADLVAYAGSQLSQIEQSYTSSLRDKEIKQDLLIAIKNLMENLRSALDYVAHRLFAKYGTSIKPDPKVYFPYAHRNQQEAEFRRRVEVCIPGLQHSRPDIVDKLCSYQCFADPENTWLPAFMDLNNQNKHQHLTPQTRKEAKQLRLGSGGAAITLGQGAAITLGRGAQIRVGDMLIPGGQRIDVNNPPITGGGGKKEVVTWVSFSFTDNGEPVLPFLRSAVEGVATIVRELSAQ